VNGKVREKSSSIFRIRMTPKDISMVFFWSLPLTLLDDFVYFVEVDPNCVTC
jgi:hypothetical protein